MYSYLNLFKYSHVVLFWLLHNGGGQGFLLTGAYFWGRAYITSILKNHTSAYFQVRSYFRENKVVSQNRLKFHLIVSVMKNQ